VPSPVYTAVAMPAGGTIVVNQSTGAISYCTGEVLISGIGPGGSTVAPIGVCIVLGKATPTLGSTTSLTVVPQPSGAFVVNNDTGAILQCATYNLLYGTTDYAFGACKSMGNAAN
jgi:hypothetical protein